MAAGLLALIVSESSLIFALGLPGPACVGGVFASVLSLREGRGSDGGLCLVELGRWRS